MVLLVFVWDLCIHYLQVIKGQVSLSALLGTSRVYIIRDCTLFIGGTGLEI